MYVGDNIKALGTVNEPASHVRISDDRLIFRE